MGKIRRGSLEGREIQKTLRIRKKGSYNVIIEAKLFYQSFGIHHVMIIRLLKVLKLFQ